MPTCTNSALVKCCSYSSQHLARMTIVSGLFKQTCTFCCSCNKDDTVVTYPAFENHGRFKFRAFRFLRSFPSVYLQCDVVICDRNNANSRCARGCISRQKRDISPYTWKTNTVAGPIRLKRDLRAAEYSGKREKNKKINIHMCALHSVLLLGSR